MVRREAFRIRCWRGNVTASRSIAGRSVVSLSLWLFFIGRGATALVWLYRIIGLAKASGVYRMCTCSLFTRAARQPITSLVAFEENCQYFFIYCNVVYLPNIKANSNIDWTKIKCLMKHHQLSEIFIKDCFCSKFGVL